MPKGEECVARSKFSDHTLVYGSPRLRRKEKSGKEAGFTGDQAAYPES